MRRRLLLGILLTTIVLVPLWGWLFPREFLRYNRVIGFFWLGGSISAFIAVKRASVAISLALLVAVACVGGMLLTRPYAKRIRAQIHAVEQQLQPLLQSLRSAPRASAVGRGPLQKPFVRLLCTLAPGDSPDMTNVKLAPKWERETLGTLGARMSWDVIEPLPNVNPRSVVLVAAAWRETERTFRVVNGSVPEVRQYVRIFVVRATDRVILWRSPLLVGGEAREPLLKSPGVTYVSEFSGEKVSQSAIDEAVGQIPWNSDPHE